MRVEERSCVSLASVADNRQSARPVNTGYTRFHPGNLAHERSFMA